MRLNNIMTINFITVIRFTIFYLLNFFRYRRLAYKSLIERPLRICGRKYIEIDKNVRINKYAWLVALKIGPHDPKLIIGEGCSLGDFNHIASVHSVSFGKFVLTANGVYISDNLHGFENIHIPIMLQSVVFKSEVSIGDGTWIGEHACIIGAKIGKHCVIGANAVVTRDVPDYSVVAGAPARIIKRYNFLTMTWEKVPVQDDELQETGPSSEGKA